MIDADRQVREMAEWLRDPRNAEPSVTFPLDRERVSSPGMYAWHGDETAVALVRTTLGESSMTPLYVGQAGAASSRAKIASAATLRSRIVGNHLRGNTRASTFRRTFAVMLWEELSLSCMRPRTLDVESNARLSAWILDHLSVATAPVSDGLRLSLIEEQLLERLDPPLNLSKVPKTAGRTRLRELRRKRLDPPGTEDST